MPSAPRDVLGGGDNPCKNWQAQASVEAFIGSNVLLSNTQEKKKRCPPTQRRTLTPPASAP